MRALLLLPAHLLLLPAVVAAPDGAAIYEKQCASCHGPNGEGVADKYNETLYGTRSVESLTRYIDRNMPEGAEDQCVGEDARAVAEWMHRTFYSQEARNRMRPPRIDLTRLTNEQYRQSVADLVGSFSGRPQPFAGGGLQARYFNAEKMEEQKQKIAERVDAEVRIDPAVMEALPDLKRDSFSVTWTGSLFAPESGEYGIRAITENGVRVFLNGLPWAKDRPEIPLIDGWVSLGAEPREVEARTTLVGGRAHPLRIQYLSYGQKSASLRFEWKPPGGVWENVPAECLSKEWAPMVTTVGTNFPPDDSSYGYERGSGISREWHEAVVQAALAVANLTLPEIERLAGIKPEETDRVGKLRDFCSEFAARAFRRPLSEAERADWLREFDGVNPEDAEAVARRLVVRVLCSPRFLYPGLAGTGADDFAVASRLALVLWDSLPDEALRRAAQDGQLRTPEQISQQATRMIGDPRARHKIRGFFHHWLGLKEADDLAKDREAYPGFDDALIADLRTSLEHFVDEVMWSERSDYRDLLLADFIYMNRRLADYYGVSIPDGGGFHRVTLPADQRAGVITHPYLLATLSYHKSSSPIHRGVFLTRKVLGRFLKPPPMAIVFMDDRFDPTLSMREKVTQLTGSPACMSCHEMINPLGFSLENFDATGRWRLQDAGKPVNARDTYTTSTGEAVEFNGPRDVANHAAKSTEASSGFVRQLFQHAVKQAPDAYGSGTLEQVHQGFVADNYNIRNLLHRMAVLSAQPPTPIASTSR